MTDHPVVRRRPPRRALLAATLLGGALLVSCATQEARLVAVLPLTGDLAPYGEDIRRGVETAVQLVNAGGGVAGEPLSVTVVDDGSQPQTAASEIGSALGGGALAVVGPVGDQAFLDARAVAEEGTRAIVSPLASATNTGIGTAALFRVSPSAALEMGRLVKLLRKDLFLKDAVVFSSRDTTGRSFKGEFQDSFERLRGNVQSAASFEPGLDAAAAAELVEELRTKPGDAVVVFATGDDVVTIVQALASIEYRGEVFTTSRFHDPRFIEAAGEAANDVMYVAPTWDPSGPNASAFTEAYRAAHGSEPTVWAALGHDAVKAIADAVELSGGVYANDVPPTLRSTQFRSEGVLGTNEFDASGDVVARTLDVYGVRDGAAVPWSEYEAIWAERSQNPAGL